MEVKQGEQGQAGTPTPTPTPTHVMASWRPNETQVGFHGCPWWCPAGRTGPIVTDKHAPGPGVRGRWSSCRPGHCPPTKVSPQMSDLCELQKGCPFTSVLCSLQERLLWPTLTGERAGYWERCSILARPSLLEAPQAAWLQCGERSAKASRSSLAAPTQPATLMWALSGDAGPPLRTSIALGKFLQFPDELPTGKGWEAAANNITSPVGGDANLHHHN